MTLSVHFLYNTWRSLSQTGTTSSQTVVISRRTELTENKFPSDTERRAVSLLHLIFLLLNLCCGRRWMAWWLVTCRDEKEDVTSAAKVKQRQSVTAKTQQFIDQVWPGLSFLPRDLFRRAASVRLSVRRCLSRSCIAAKRVNIYAYFLSASLYVSKRGAYWDRLAVSWRRWSLVFGRWLVVTRVYCGQTVHPRPIVTMEH